ncbi:MAG: hypothetical protein E6J90_28010 [Deltaproteobacteria bacterium]|nr:MAG: hypothetical protein E6J90_28010 [Deltaproteobacteria bacterium]
MIKLSVREMAQYLLSDDAARLQLLRERKFVAPEAIARARFYSESRTSIAAYHRGALSRDAVEAKVVAMRTEARFCNPHLRIELLNNADVLERYLYHQGHRTLHVAPAPAAELVRSGVEIRVRPSLFAIEDDDCRRLIFLELRDKANPSAMRIIAELAYEAFRPVLWSLPPQAIQVVDVRRGIVTELQQAGSSIGPELAMACHEFTALWPELAPPRGAQPLSRAMERQMSIAWDFET